MKTENLSSENVTDNGVNPLLGNVLIADFLGWENYGDGKTYKFPNLYPIYNINDKENTGWTSDQIENAEFNKRWDWIMPVVLKININGYFFFWEDYVIRICRYSDGSGEISREPYFNNTNALNAVYSAVVKWLQYRSLNVA
jgi:hypothetical protein